MSFVFGFVTAFAVAAVVIFAVGIAAYNKKKKSGGLGT